MRFELFVLMYMKSVRKKEKETRGYFKKNMHPTYFIDGIWY